MSHVRDNEREIYRCPYCKGHVPTVKKLTKRVFAEHTRHYDAVSWTCPHGGHTVTADDERVG